MLCRGKRLFEARGCGAEKHVGLEVPGRRERFHPQDVQRVGAAEAADERGELAQADESDRIGELHDGCDSPRA